MKKYIYIVFGSIYVKWLTKKTKLVFFKLIIKKKKKNLDEKK